MDVIPARLSLSQDWNRRVLQDVLGELVDLSTPSRNRATTVAYTISKAKSRY